MLTQRPVDRTYPPRRTLYCSKAWMQVNYLHRHQPMANDGEEQNAKNDEQEEKIRKMIAVQKLIIHVSLTVKNRGWVLLNEFLGRQKARCALDEVKMLYETPGKFHDGQLVKPKNGSPTASIRSDKICWFDEKVDRHCVNVRLIIDSVTSIVTHMTGIPYKLISRSKAMLTCYPGDGARYIKHVDNPNSEGRGRRVTAIYYLNPQWKPEDGGSLRLYPSNCASHFDIEPLADNLVLFWSDSRNPHEVLPSFAMRYAIVLWYFDENNENTVTAGKKEDQFEKRRD